MTKSVQGDRPPWRGTPAENRGQGNRKVMKTSGSVKAEGLGDGLT